MISKKCWFLNDIDAKMCFFRDKQVLAYFLDARLPYIEPFVTSALSRNVEQL